MTLAKGQCQETIRQVEKNSLRNIIIKKAYVWFQARNHMQPMSKAGKLRAANVHWRQAREKLGKPSDVWFVHPPDWPTKR